MRFGGGGGGGASDATPADRPGPARSSGAAPEEDEAATSEPGASRPDGTDAADAVALGGSSEASWQYHYIQSDDNSHPRDFRTKNLQILTEWVNKGRRMPLGDLRPCCRQPTENARELPTSNAMYRLSEMSR